MTSPCLTCDTLADCATCVPRLAYEGAQIPPEPEGCGRCSDAEWLLLCGEAWEQVAARLHLTPESLRRHLQRHRPDLVPPRRDRGAA